MIRKHYAGFWAVAAALVAVGLLVCLQPAKANPSDFCAADATGEATTSLAFMSAGTGTTTLNLTNCSAGSAVSGAYVQLQWTASTTGSLLARVEHSQDRVDWYAETTNVNELATSTIMSGDAATLRFNLSTTTDNGGTGTAARLHRSFRIATPTKYTRVIFYVPTTGGANGALWAQGVGKKEI